MPRCICWAVRAKSDFQASNPELVLPQDAAWTAPAIRLASTAANRMRIWISLIKIACCEGIAAT